MTYEKHTKLYDHKNQWSRLLSELVHDVVGPLLSLKIHEHRFVFSIGNSFLGENKVDVEHHKHMCQV